MVARDFQNIPGVLRRLLSINHQLDTNFR